MLNAERRQRESLHSISWKQSLLNWRVIAMGFIYMGITVPLYGLSFFLPQRALVAWVMWRSASSTPSRTW